MFLPYSMLLIASPCPVASHHKMKRIVLILLLALSVLFLPRAVYAHLAGMTDTSIQIGASQVKVIYTLPTDSVSELNGVVAASESNDAIRQALVSGFHVTNNQRPCDVSEYQVRRLAQVQSHQFVMLFDCADTLDELYIDYQLFVDRFPEHENFVRIAMGGKYISRVFSAAEHDVQLPVAATLKNWGVTLTNNFVDDPNSTLQLAAQPDYFSLGLEHILLGFDHLLFLFALLLLPLSLRQLLTMVTAFTVAHSITLAMAVFGVVSLPAIWVEAVIALSIVYVGLENLLELRNARSLSSQPFATPWKRRVAVTFCFGLIHGFGFSYVLQEIGLGDQVASALLFFNLGVETGQLLAVVVVFPVLLWIFRRDPRFGFSRVSSVLVILLGGLWLVERLMTVLQI